jgi:predicted nucleic-acid-binding protein
VIAIDTNVLVRYLVADDQRQAERAKRLVDSAREAGEKVFVGQIVLCETIWVLEGAYRAQKRDLLTALQRLVESDVFELERPRVVRRASDLFAQGKADFAEYLLGQVARAEGAAVTYTFDRQLKGASLFALA